MPRPCSVCTHPDGAEIDRALAAGTGSTDVARAYGLSRYAVDRHRSPGAGHIPEGVLVEAWQAHRQAEVRPADVVTRLVDLASDAATVRLRAVATGRDQTVLKAIEVERGLLADLANRVGITTETARQAVAESDALVMAHLDLARTDPALGRRLVAALRRRDAPAGLVAAVEATTTHLPAQHTEETR